MITKTVSAQAPLQGSSFLCGDPETWAICFWWSFHFSPWLPWLVLKREDRLLKATGRKWSILLPLIVQCLKLAFSTWALWHVGLTNSLLLTDCPMQLGMYSSIPGFFTPHARRPPTAVISKVLLDMSPGGGGGQGGSKIALS